MNLLDSLILGVIEGITEFLPVSSTGHMILAGTLLGLDQGTFEKTFEIAIQLGAILSVILIYRERLSRDLDLWKKLGVAFFPTGVAGLLFHRYVEGLFTPWVVSAMLVLWGAILVGVEIYERNREKKIFDPGEIDYPRAFLIGVFQSLAMIPGTSRSGATIAGGLLLGIERKTATEFSFLLAIPTMLSATLFELVKNARAISPENWIVLGAGFATAFVSAWLSVKWLLRFIKTHSFIPFGVYRIAVGSLFALIFL